MDPISKSQRASISPTQATPSPKVSLSSSSSLFSFPIRAPPTIDSDFEYNGLKNSSTSSFSSDSGFESEGFVSGEDEFQFETASERPSSADPDEETLEESSVVSRPRVVDPYQEVIETSGHVHEYGVSRPVAHLSGDSDDDSVVSEVLDDYGFSVPVRVSGTGLIEKLNISPKVKVSDGEEDESQFDTLREAEVVEEGSNSGEVVDGVLDSYEEKGPNELPYLSVDLVKAKSPDELDSISVELIKGKDTDGLNSSSAELVKEKGPDEMNSISAELDKQLVPDEVDSISAELDKEIEPDEMNSISAELVKEKGPDVTEEVEAQSSVEGEDPNELGFISASKEYASLENLEINQDEKYSVEEILALEDMEKESENLGEESAVQRNRVGFSNNVAIKTDTTDHKDVVVNCVKDKEVVEDEAVIAPAIDTVSGVMECKPLETDKDAASTNKTVFVVDEKGSEANEDFVVGKMGLESIDVDSDSTLLETGALSTQVVEQSFPSEMAEQNLQGNEVEVGALSKMGLESTDVDSDSTLLEAGALSTQVVEQSFPSEMAEVTEVDGNVKFGEVLSDNQNCEKDGAVVNESSILDGEVNNEISYSEVEQQIDGGIESHDSVEASIFEPELEVKNKDKSAGEEEDSLSAAAAAAAEGLTFGDSETAKQIISELDQRFSPVSLFGEGTSQDRSQRIDGQIATDSDEEVDTDEESEGKEVFDSAALAALLRAAGGAGLDGGSVKITSSNNCQVFSIKPEQKSPNLVGGESESEKILSEEENKKLEEIQQIRVKFLRLVHRLGLSAEDSIAAQVLYRLALSGGGPSSRGFGLDSAKMVAMEVEEEGKNDLNFSLNILVIGKTGVGKSATINSIYGEERSTIDAFEPATTSIKEIVGTIDGVEVRVLDTPGLRSSLREQSFNMKILSSIKRFMKKYPPNVVLYVDRVDTQTRDLNDLPLLRSITSCLGSSIWRNAIVTLTHAGSMPPDGPSGSPLSYEVFVAQRSRIIKQLISHVIGDLHMMNSGLMNPVSLVENHPLGKKNGSGQIFLPNGESWRPQLLLLCYSMKILSEANSVVKTQDPLGHSKLFGFRVRSPPLPYFLSSLLQSNSHPKLDQGVDNVDSDVDVRCLFDSDLEDEDEYDQLPPFKPLRKSQISNLSKEQKKAYFEEYDYRVKLLQKKQLREDVKRLREIKKEGVSGDVEDSGDHEMESPATVPVPLPDMVLPPSFDGDNPAYRYRFLEPVSQILMRPVLDAQGWDHDWGYDGVSIEQNLALADRFPAVIAVQITKDKKEFNIHMDSAVSAKHGENGSTMAGIDIQTIGKQLAYIFKGETKMKNFKTNKTAAGVSVTFLGENVVTGVKLEDQLAVGRRLVLVGSTGATRSQGDYACGANFELRIKEKDFPIGQDQTTVALSLVRWRGDLIWGCNLQSQFSIGRSSSMALRAGLNNRKSGQITIRTSSSEQLQIALVGFLPIANAIFKNMLPRCGEKYS